MIDEQMIKQHLDAFGASNWDAFKAALANDAVFEEVPSGQRATGVEAYMEAVKRWKKAFPDLKATITNTFVAGNRLISEVEWEGTHRGVLEGPMGTIQPTNNRGRVNAVLITTVKNDKIVATRHYFDMLSLLSQIGIAPVRAPAEQATPAGAPRQRH